MLYIKTVVNQDLDKETAFQFGPSMDFFHIDCTDTTAKKYNLSFIFRPSDGDSFKEFDGETINTTIHFNAEKNETRITSELKQFLKSKCDIHAEDLLLFYRDETTQRTSIIRPEKIFFRVIKKSSNEYDRYRSLIFKNSWNCIVSENITVNNSTGSCTCSETDAEERNIIFYGAPGTGKSTEADRLQKQMNFKTFRTTFHPESDYFSFVGSYKPTTKQDGSGNISYSFVPQAFINAYLYAWTFHETEKVCLIIEEINRGNCAQIFGDIFQLLDRNSDTGCSRYFIDVDEDCAMFIKNHFENISVKNHNDFPLSHYKESIARIAGIKDEEFSFNKIALPDNLYLYATMNTSDQSLYPMDSAFKRRWQWKYIPIDYSIISDVQIKIGQKSYLWSDFLYKINRKIVSLTQSEDKQLGQFFIPVTAGIITATQFRDKVLFYLWNDIYKDEFGTSGTIFKVSVEGAEEKQFTFSDLFIKDSDYLINGLMETIGVNPLSDNYMENSVQDKIYETESDELSSDTDNVKDV